MSIPGDYINDSFEIGSDNKSTSTSHALYRCSHCTYETYDKNSLDFHNKDIHKDLIEIQQELNGPINYWCKYCDFKTIIKDKLFYHVEKNHANMPQSGVMNTVEKPNIFEQVNKVQAAMDEINERPLSYKCNDCGKVYEQYHYCEGSLDEPIKLNELLVSCNKTFNDCFVILEKKNNDYASLGNPFKNFDYIEHLGIKSEVGVLVRLNDKMMRISNLLQREAFVTNETVEDTINDAINYLAILKAILQRNENLREPTINA